jgi:hypothetical protein
MCVRVRMCVTHVVLHPCTHLQHTHHTALTMNRDLGFGPAVYGLGTGEHAQRVARWFGGVQVTGCTCVTTGWSAPIMPRLCHSTACPCLWPCPCPCLLLRSFACPAPAPAPACCCVPSPAPAALFFLPFCFFQASSVRACVCAGSVLSGVCVCVRAAPPGSRGCWWLVVQTPPCGTWQHLATNNNLTPPERERHTHTRAHTHTHTRTHTHTHLCARAGAQQPHHGARGRAPLAGAAGVLLGRRRVVRRAHPRRGELLHAAAGAGAV